METLVEIIKESQFKRASAILINKSLSTREALQIIYALYSSITQENNVIIPQDVLLLINTYKSKVLCLIDEFTEREFVLYFQCLHFIVKWISQEQLTSVLELEGLILVDLSQVVGNEKIRTFYRATYISIYKAVTESTNLSNDNLIKLLLLQLRMRLLEPAEFCKNMWFIFAHFYKISLEPQDHVTCLVKILNFDLKLVREEINEFSSAILTSLKFIYYTSGITKTTADISKVIVRLKSVGGVSKVVQNILNILNKSAINWNPSVIDKLQSEISPSNLIEADTTVIQNIHMLIGAVMLLWRNIPNIASEITNNLCAIIPSLKNIYKHFKCYIKSCSCCNLELDLDAILQLLQSIVALLKIANVANNYIDIHYILEDICENLLELKQAGCKNFSRFWSKCYPLIHFLGSAMLAANDSNGVRYYETLFKYVGIFDLPTGINNGYVQFAQHLVPFLTKQKEYEDALFFCAVSLYNTQHQDILKHWSLALYNILQSNGKDTGYNTVSILNLNIDKTKQYIPQLKSQIPTKKSQQLLSCELNFYVERWPSKTSISSTFLALTKVANVEVLCENLLKCYPFLIEGIGDEFLPVFQQLIQNLKPGNRKPLYSAVLNYLIANIIANSFVEKNLLEMRDVIIPQKIEPSNHEPIPHPNDECVFVTSYSCLTISNHKTIYKHFKIVISDIHLYLQCRSFEEGYLKIAYELCTMLAHTYRLHGIMTLNEEVWFLAKSIAEKQRDNVNISECIGWLLDKADLNETTNALSQEGMVILKQLDNTERICWYRLHLCNFYFRNCKWAEAVDEYKATNDLINLMQPDVNEILAVHFEFLKSSITRLPCYVAQSKNPHIVQMKPKKALIMLIDYINKIGFRKPTIHYTLAAYFEEVEDLVTRFYLLRLPRQLRCYGKEVVRLAQKLCLPIRAGRFLTALARADTLSCRIDDCSVKVDGIVDVLSLNGRRPMVESPLELGKRSNQTDDVVVYDEMVDQMREMHLDVPIAPSLTGSPTLTRRIYTLPPYMRHDVSCDCFECTTPEYAHLFLCKLHLDFLLGEIRSDSDLSDVIYKSAVDVYEFVLKHKSYARAKCTDYVKQFHEICAYLLLDYAIKLMRLDLDQAKVVNSQLMELLKHLPGIDRKLLHCEALVQRMNILTHERRVNTHNHVVEQEDVDCLTVESATVIVTTPENKQSTVNLKQAKCIITTPKVDQRRPKIMPFTLPDDENEEPHVTAVKPSTKRVDRSPQPVPKFTVLDEALTAALTEVEAKFKPVSVRKKAPSKATAPVVLKTPCVSSATKERTAAKAKLLTEKIKKSTRKLADNCGDGDMSPGTSSKNIRKNLLKDLKDCDQTPKVKSSKSASSTAEATVRKSSRRP